MHDEGKGHSLSRVEVLAYVLAGLGGVDRSAHLEEVAAEAHRVAPGASR